MFPYAEVLDVESRWRPLTTIEQDLAQVLIEDAADIIRSRWTDVGDRLASGALEDLTLRRVIAGMVRRAMLNRDAEGVTQIQQTTGPFSDGATFTNPNNNLYLSADDVRALEPNGYKPVSRMGWLV